MILQLVSLLKLGIIGRWKKQLELNYPDKTISWLLLPGFPGLPWPLLFLILFGLIMHFFNFESYHPFFQNLFFFNLRQEESVSLA